MFAHNRSGSSDVSRTPTLTQSRGLWAESDVYDYVCAVIIIIILLFFISR